MSRKCVSAPATKPDRWLLIERRRGEVSALGRLLRQRPDDPLICAAYDKAKVALLKAHKIDANPEWPTESRIDAIAQNGPTGEHYTEREPGPTPFAGRKTRRAE